MRTRGTQYETNKNYGGRRARWRILRVNLLFRTFNANGNIRDVPMNKYTVMVEFNGPKWLDIKAKTTKQAGKIVMGRIIELMLKRRLIKLDIIRHLKQWEDKDI